MSTTPNDAQPIDEQQLYEAQDVALSLPELKQILEAMLFSCNEPISADKLAKLAGGIDAKVVAGLLRELEHDYDERQSGLMIIEIAGGFQMSTRATLSDWVLKLQKQRRRTLLSPATLETLSIIAYKQPVTRAEVEAIRGVDSSAPLRTLVDLNLIAIGGKKEVVGRPQLYITAENFLKVFGLSSLGSLPSIPELKEMFAGQYSWLTQPHDTEEPFTPIKPDLMEPSLFGVQPRTDIEEAAEPLDAELTTITTPDLFDQTLE